MQDKNMILGYLFESQAYAAVQRVVTCLTSPSRVLHQHSAGGFAQRTPPTPCCFEKERKKQRGEKKKQTSRENSEPATRWKTGRVFAQLP